MDTRFLAYLELKQDFLFDKIPHERIKYYIDSSLSAGLEVARDLPNRSVQTLINRENIEVVVKQDDGEFFKVKLRAQFEFDPKGNHKIFVYKKSMLEFSETCGISLQLAMDVHLAHELFHFYEYKNKTIVAENLDPIVNFSVLGFKSRAHINRCSEIAAHRFVMAILNLELMPNYYDYVYLLNEGKITEDVLDSWEIEYQAIVALG